MTGRLLENAAEGANPKDQTHARGPVRNSLARIAFLIAFAGDNTSMLDQVLTAVATAIVDTISALGYLGVLGSHGA